MKKIYLLLLATMLIGGTTFSQTVNYYAFAASTGATPDAMTGATTIVAANDIVSTVQTIPFTFVFDGKSYTQFSVSVQGFIQMGSTAATSNSYNNTYSARNMIYPFWSNLATGANGMVSYVVTGTAPNRIVKIQWFVIIPGTADGNANSTMQAWLYEGTNVIDFRYGAAGTPTLGASIGMTGGQGDRYISVTASTNSASTTHANDNNGVWPGNGTMYKFTPPVVSACVRPGTQPTMLTLPDRSYNFIGGYFHKASGPASAYLVVYSRGALTGTPVDGIEYTTGDSIGNGKVSQSGDSTTLGFTAFGLMGNTDYIISIFSYNIGQCFGGPLYNYRFPLTGISSTCTAAPVAGISNLSSNAATIVWPSVKGGGANAITYTVEVATDNSFTNVIPGSPFVVNDPVTSVSISGLAESTTYYYRVKASGTCTTIPIKNFTTPCAPAPAPYVQNFDTSTPPGMPACIKVEDVQGSTTWTTATAPSGYSGNVAKFTYDNFQYADDWLYTQGVNLTGGIPYTIGYKFGNDPALYNDGQKESIEVQYGTSPVSTAMTTLIMYHSNFSYLTPKVDTVNFTPPTTGIYYFGFHAYGYIFAYSPYYLYLDSIVLKPTGSVLPLTLGYFNAKRNGAVNELSWSTRQEANTQQFVIERSTDGRKFVTIGQVAAAGNSTMLQAYRFVDKAPASGINYYRLKMMDKDATARLSDVRTLKFSTGLQLAVYPNPVKHVLLAQVNALKADNGFVTISEINGHEVYKNQLQVLPGQTQLNIAVSHLPAGTYIIKLQLKDETLVTKFLKQ